MSRDVSQETLTSSSSRRVSDASAAASLDTACNVDLKNPHAPVGARAKRVITQPPFGGDAVAQQAKLVQSAQEDRELEESSCAYARAPGIFRQNSANSNSSSTLVGSTDAVTQSADVSSARKPVKSAIAMFENLQQSESGRKTTVVVIRRDERGPSNDVTQHQNKSRASSSATGARNANDDATPPPSNLKVEVLKLPADREQHATTQGSVEAGLYSSVRKVERSTGATHYNDATNARQTGDVSKSSDDDDDGDVKIIEIARL